MAISRREFIRGGVSAFTIGFAAPAFLSDLARAQGASARNLVIVYLGGGNDALNTVVPYTDPFYFSRRPNIAVPAGQVLQIGSDSSGRPLGLHPRLTGLRDLFNGGRLAIVQATGYLNSSRSHFQGKDIWDTANPTLTDSEGWLGLYLETVPLDPLSGWRTTQELPRAERAIGSDFVEGDEIAAAGRADIRTHVAFNRRNPGRLRTRQWNVDGGERRDLAPLTLLDDLEIDSGLRQAQCRQLDRGAYAGVHPDEAAGRDGREPDGHG
jgi:hypothetical protein